MRRGPETSSTDVGTPQREPDTLTRFLYRRIAFMRPGRVAVPHSWVEHIPFAFWMVEALKPAQIVELGTHSGNSYAAFAQAVQTLGLPTVCTAIDTWQGDPHSGLYPEDVFTDWSGYHDARFGTFSRLFRTTFAEAAPHFAEGSIDLLHIDGYHTYDALSEDLAIWRSKLSRRGVILLHDVHVHERDFAAWRVWEEIKDTAPSFDFLHGYGLGVLGVGADLPEPVQWLLRLMPDQVSEIDAVREFFGTLGRVISAEFELARAERLIDTMRAQTLVEGAPQTQEVREAPNAEAARHLAALENHVASQQAELEDANRDKVNLTEELYRLRNQSQQHWDRLNSETSLLQTRAGRSALRVRALEHRVESYETSRWWKLVRPLDTFFRTLTGLGCDLASVSGFARTAMSCVLESGRLRAAYVITKSELFDEAYYRGMYPDASSGRSTPLAHFLARAASEERSPHPLFDSAWYSRQNPGVESTGVHHLVHYLKSGAREGRAPHPLFDVTYYTRAITDRAMIGENALADYLRRGRFEGRSPHPLFDADFYCARNPDVVQAGMDPFVHFVTFGGKEGRDPGPAFDSSAYLGHHADARQSGMNPLLHSVLTGR